MRTSFRRFPFPSSTTIVAFLVAVFAVVTTAAAQSGASGKWEIELYSGGAALPTNLTAGKLSLPGPGAAFTTSGIYPPPAPQVLVVATSRREASWYFGDGALLFNQAAVALAANPVAQTAPFPGRMVTLDPVLGRALGDEGRGANIGARVTRLVTPRFGVEVSVAYDLARVGLTPENSDSVEATRASFVTAFNGLITSNPGRVLQSLTSIATLDGGSAHQVQTNGVLVVNLLTTRRIVPYATAGAAWKAIVGVLPSVTLQGNYQFQNASGSRINESDSVTVTDARARNSLAAILGAGVKYPISSRWAIRVDARFSLSENSGRTVLDATPNVVLGTLPSGRTALNADPTIQFGNSTEPVTSLGVTAVSPSTLSGPPIRSLQTWSGSGLSYQGHLTVGLFWRF